MPDQTLLDEIKSLIVLKNHWYSLAQTTSKFLEIAEYSVNSRPRRLLEVSHASGYSTNTLNRMIAVKDFFDSTRNDFPKLREVDANNLPFTTLEVVKRLHQVDAMQGIEMLNEVIAGRITIRQLRELYNSTVADKTDVASGHQVSKLEGRAFESAALTAVRAFASNLFGEPFVISSTPPSFPPICAVGRRSGDLSPLPAIGFDFFLTRMRASDQAVRLDRFLLRTLVYSGFVSRYWVIFASSVGMHRIGDFCEVMERLDRRSIGVAVLPWGDEITKGPEGAESLKILLEPSGDPSPDWRHQFYSVAHLRKSMNSPRE